MTRTSAANELLTAALGDVEIRGVAYSVGDCDAISTVVDALASLMQESNDA